MSPTFIQIIDLKEHEESEYWMVVSDVFEGREILSAPSSSDSFERSSPESFTSSSLENGVNNKVSMHRTCSQRYGVNNKVSMHKTRSQK